MEGDSGAEVIVPRRARSAVSHALGSPSFRWYLAGMAMFGLVQTMMRFLLPWLAYEVSHSSTMLGLIGLALAAPTLLLSPLGGVWADRMERLRIVRRAQLGTAILFAVFAIIFALGAVSLPLIAAVAIFSGCLLAFDQPARQALIPSLVPTSGLGGAYALIAAIWNVAGLVGPSLAAALLAVFIPLGLGSSPIFALNALGSVAMVIMTTRIKADALVTTREEQLWWHEVVIGVRFILHNPVAGPLTALAFGASVFGLSSVFIMPAIAAEVYQADVTQLGILVSAWGAGALVGITTMMLGLWDRHRGRVVLIAPVALGVSLVAFSQSRTFELSTLLISLAGALAFIYMTLAQTILQLLVPDALRGRVMGIYALNFAIAPLGATVLGVLGGFIGAAEAVGVGAIVLCGLAAVVIYRVRSISVVA